MSKIKKKSIEVLSKLALSAKAINMLKGGNSETYDAQGNIIIEDIING